MARSTKNQTVTRSALATVADHIASTITARMVTSAALAKAMDNSTTAANEFKGTTFAEIVTLRANYIAQIPSKNKAIAEIMHAKYVSDVRELFGFGNAKQAGLKATDGTDLYSPGLIYQAVLASCRDQTKANTACEVFSKIRKIALAVWFEPSILTDGKGEHRSLNNVARDAVSLLKTGKVAPVETASKGTQAKPVIVHNGREALEVLIAREGAGAVLAWVAELLAADVTYRKSHGTSLAALTALAKQV